MGQALILRLVREADLHGPVITILMAQNALIAEDITGICTVDASHVTSLDKSIQHLHQCLNVVSYHVNDSLRCDNLTVG